MTDQARDPDKPNSRLHIYSGILLITVDNALWGANIVTLGLATPFISLLAFLVTGTAVFFVQKFLSVERVGVAVAKGFVVGIMAGVPTSIVGTLGGIYVLGQAGLRAVLGRR